MTVPFWCLLIVALLPYVLAGVGGYFKQQQFGKVDNNDPRLQGAKLEGSGARAWAAQQNAWEAFALFGAAVLVAHIAGADPGSSSIAAIVFVCARVLHAIFYVSNMATPRSLIFVVGFASCMWLFGLAASA